MFTETVTYPAAFLAGLLSFFSPCILPLIPAYFTFITGYSLDELTTNPGAAVRTRVLLSTLAYVAGFACVFILMGASASYLGRLAFAYRDIIRVAGGLLIIVLGVHLTGLVRIGLLDFEKRVHPRKKPLHFLGTFLVGMAFGAGWSPCIGPLLGSILIVAGSQETVAQGVWLLATYSAGMALPFLVIALSIDLVLRVIRKAVRSVNVLNRIAGVLLIILGLLLVSDKIYWLNLYPS